MHVQCTVTLWLSWYDCLNSKPTNMKDKAESDKMNSKANFKTRRNLALFPHGVVGLEPAPVRSLVGRIRWAIHAQNAWKSIWRIQNIHGEKRVSCEMTTKVGLGWFSTLERLHGKIEQISEQTLRPRYNSCDQWGNPDKDMKGDKDTRARLFVLKQLRTHGEEHSERGTHLP